MEVKDKYIKTEVGLLPSEWVSDKLNTFWDVTDCKHLTALFVENGIPVVSIQDVQSRYVNFENSKKTTEYYYKKLIEGGRKPIAGDLIFSRNATVGEVAQVPEIHFPFALGQDVCLLRKKNINFSSDYFQSVLRSPIVTRQLENLMVGSTFKRVNIEQIKNFYVPMPPVLEQTAIATALSDTDALISSLEKLIAKKRAIKQGAMQELLKLKEGWVRTKLEEIAQVKSGKRLPLGKSLLDKKTPFPYIRIVDMKNGSVSMNDLKYVPEDVYPVIKNYRIFKEDIYISVAGTLGIIGVIPEVLDGANLTENANRLTDIKCNRNYLAIVLKSDIIQSRIEAERTLGAQPKLALTRIRNFEIPLPSLEEQKCIASILMDIEFEITALESKLSKYRQIKSGMMQNLLTGKIRLV